MKIGKKAKPPPPLEAVVFSAGDGAVAVVDDDAGVVDAVGRDLLLGLGHGVTGGDQRDDPDRDAAPMKMRLRFLRPSLVLGALLLLHDPVALGPLAGAALGQGGLAGRRVLVLLTNAARRREAESAVSSSGSTGVPYSSRSVISASPVGHDPHDVSAVGRGHHRQCRAAQRARNPAQIDTE